MQYEPTKSVRGKFSLKLIKNIVQNENVGGIFFFLEINKNIVPNKSLQH